MANAGVTVGSVWLDVLPSMRDFGSQLVNQTEGASRQAGQRAGDALGEGTERGFKGRVAAIAAVGSVIGAAVGVAVSAAIDIQAGQAKLVAQLGLTTAEGERYGRLAGQLYAGAYGESLEQVNEAIAGVHRNIGENLNDADLTTITKGVLNLASAFEVDVGGATAAVGQMLKTGLAPDAQTAMDVITQGFQQGVDKAGDFLDTINEYATQFRKLGLDGATATGIIQQGLQAGARDADIVADALKEFSIRAVDGSKASSEAYKALGLDAATLTAQIARGGPEASAGLQLVLDRLRGMKDPVAQSAAAVGLFGTQAEDLGAALYALDPSTAVSALGDVGEAANYLDTVLGQTAQAQITSFMRTMQVAFVQVVGGYVIPIIMQLAGIIGPLLGPALAFVGQLITGTIVPAFQAFGQWVQNNTSWLVPLAVGIGAFVLALNAASIATTLWGLATSAASAIVSVVRGVVMSFQVAMWLLNAAMSANPIGIIVALLVGLVAGLIAAYQSSETFRNFVDALWEAIKVGAAAAWDVIQGFFGWLGGAASAVGSALAAGWAGAVAAFQAVGAAASWLWSTILEPVFSAIGLAARVLVAVIFTVLVAPWLIAFELLGQAASYLWTNWIQPAIALIQAGLTLFGTAWDTYVVQPFRIGMDLLASLFGGFQTQASGVFDMIKVAWAAAWAFIDSTIFAPIRLGIDLLVIGFNIWRDASILAWQNVQAGLAAAWAWIDANVFSYVRIGLNLLIAGFNFYKDGAILAWQLVQAGLAAAWAFIQSNVLAPLNQYLIGPLVAGFNLFRDAAITAWNNLRDGINTVWQFILNNIWNPLVNFVTRDIPNAFNTAVEAVGRVWEGLREKFAAPIRFVVDVVYNKGIVPAWNWIATKVGLGALSTVPLGFARGGSVPGSGNGDTVPAMLTPGEFVFSKKAVRAMGGVDILDRWHQAARSGRGKSTGMTRDYVMFGGDPSEPGLAYFADGGAVARAQAYARSQHGKPYQWGGVGNPSFDCSGFMSAIACVALGRGIGRLFTTGSFGPGRGAGGFVPGTGSAFVIGVRNGNPGHMAGNIGGMNVESGGHGVLAPGGPGPMSFPMQFFLPQVGGQFVGGEGGGSWFDPAAWVKQLFAKAIDALAGLAGDNEWATMGAELAKTSVNGAVDWFVKWVTDNISKVWGVIAQALPFDSGGYLPTGWSTVYNGTGRPEPVLTTAQWQAIADGGAGGDGAALGDRFDDLIRAVQNARPITVEDRSGNPVETARAAQLALRLAR